MSKRIYSIHGTDAAKLAAVVVEMRARGAPTIRVVDCGDYYQALEGTHRLAAAAELGIDPHLVVLAQDDLVEIDSLDYDNGYFVSGETYAAGEIAGEIKPHTAYSF